MIRRILLTISLGWLLIPLFSISIAGEPSKTQPVPEKLIQTYGLVPVDPKFKVVQGSEIVIENMPRVLSQASLGICYAFSVVTLFNYAYCVDKNINPCNSASDDMKASTFDMTRFNRTLESGKDNRSRFSYEGLPIDDGGGAAFTLYNALNTSSVAKESCAPFENFVAKMKSPQEAADMEAKNWKRIRDAYLKYKEISKTCVTCGTEYATAIEKEFKYNFNLKTSNKEILQAFASESYDKFLDKLLIPDHCWDLDQTLSLSPKWTQKIFPENGKGDYSSFINQIKATLLKKSPIALGFCTETPLKVKSKKECDNIMTNGIKDGQGHSVVIKGYRKVCNSKNVCRESLQVQNSWGQGWQDQNNDGWVDAKELLDRTFYESQQLTWIEKEAP